MLVVGSVLQVTALGAGRWSIPGKVRRNLYLLRPLNTTRREGLAQPFIDSSAAQKSLCYPGARDGLLRRNYFGFDTHFLCHPRVPAAAARHRIEHFVQIFAPFGLPAAALEYIFEVVRCSN